MHNAGETNFIEFGSERISFNVKYSRRRTLALHVFPGGEVSAVAPKDAPIEKIREKVEKKAGWILRQKWHFASFNAVFPKRQYVSGETHRYLGKQYRLKVLSSSENSVRLIGGYLKVQTKDGKNHRRIKSLMEEWYREHAKTRFPLILSGCIRRIRKFGIPDPVLEVKTMEKRWGSCSSAGKLTLNLELIKAPVHCIEYVIVHELCHLKQHHHGKEFFEMLRMLMPDWEKRKIRLEKLMSSV